jgi:PPIC-type PPIASE domain
LFFILRFAFETSLSWPLRISMPHSVPASPHAGPALATGAAIPAATDQSLKAHSALPARWLREPLLHFVVLGALLFAADHFFASRTDDPGVIKVAKEVTDEARNTFRAARGREPDSQELEALTRRWIDNEILFREGMAMRVDQGDKMIRDRVIFKSLMMVESGLKRPPVDDSILREWFEKNRIKYDDPARYDFQEAVLSAGTSDAAAHAFAQALNAGAPGDTQAGLRVFKARPSASLEQSYGVEFAKALEGTPAGEWRALPTRDGLRVIRVDAVLQPKPGSFEGLRNIVLLDWTDATMAQLRTDAVRQRGKKYTVQVDDTAKPR